jgi:hypothetical protein
MTKKSIVGKGSQIVQKNSQILNGVGIQSDWSVRLGVPRQTLIYYRLTERATRISEDIAMNLENLMR